ncbi:MAG: 4'-phosphopantetheinyl transferase family protein [Gemmatimonadaceae bacterium]
MARAPSLNAAPRSKVESWMNAAPGGAAMNPAEVHVWRFPLGDSGRAGSVTNLSDDERARAGEMKSQAVRQSYAHAQSALREVLSGYTRTNPRSIELMREPRGKPTLASPMNSLQFNVSHSGDWGLVAVARFPVGVDVERIRTQCATPALANRFLTRGERDLVEARQQSLGEAAFFSIWCRKEAYLKAVGFGLSAPFSEVDSSGERLPNLDEHGRQIHGATPWAIEEFFVDDRHPAAVVARAPQLSLHFFTLRGPDL